MKVQSFQSNRSLISGVLLTTGTIQYHKRSKTQKAKVKESKSESGHIHPKVKVATFTKKHMKDLLLKNLTGSSSSHPPLRPLLFSSLAPSASLLRPERPPHSAQLLSSLSIIHYLFEGLIQFLDNADGLSLVMERRLESRRNLSLSL